MVYHIVKRYSLFLPQCLILLGLLLIICPLFIPLTPKMPASDVDSSWAIGLNQAVAQGLIFGKQIVFTLGPYSAIYTKMYHPATDPMMLWGSIYLAFSYWVVLCLLYIRKPSQWVFAFGLFLLMMIYAKDSLFFSYPLLVGLLIISHCEWGAKISNWRLSFLLAPFGLFPLIKGSLLLCCGLTSLLLVVWFFLHRKYRSAGIALLVPVFALYGFWLISGQQAMYLLNYIRTSLEMAFAFSGAMSNLGSASEVLGYILASVLILYFIIKEPIARKQKLFLGILFASFLFLSFKAGFTRHLGHAFIAGTSIGMASLLLPYFIKAKRALPMVIGAVLLSLYIDGHYTQINVLRNVYSTYSAAWFGAVNRLQNPLWLLDNYTIIMSYLRAQNALPIVDGSSDVYSYGQTDLIASGNLWLPRPIFQSYSVFNESLATLNNEHLKKSSSPKHLFFAIQPIDNRLPSMEDGPSWLSILSYYQLKSRVKNWLVLKKNEQQVDTPVIRPISKTKSFLGAQIFVHSNQTLLFARIHIKPTFWGRLVSFLFKSPELTIELNTSNGLKKAYRFIPQMAEAGFLLSPLINNTEQFAYLFQCNQLVNSLKVTYFTIKQVGDSKIPLWQNNYEIEWSELNGLT